MQINVPGADMRQATRREGGSHVPLHPGSGTWHPDARRGVPHRPGRGAAVRRTPAFPACPSRRAVAADLDVQLATTAAAPALATSSNHCNATSMPAMTARITRCCRSVRASMWRCRIRRWPARHQPHSASRPATSRYLAAHARTADLTVLGRARDGEKVTLHLLETVLLESGRPLLIAPETARPSIGRHIAIAWKDSAGGRARRRRRGAAAGAGGDRHHLCRAGELGHAQRQRFRHAAAQRAALAQSRDDPARPAADQPRPGGGAAAPSSRRTAPTCW